MPDPQTRFRYLVPTLLGLAAVALVGPWNGGRIASAVAAAAVLAAFGLTSWSLGRAEAGRASVSEVDRQPLLDRLDRIATALESRPAAASAPAEAIDALRPIAAAIAEKRWSDVDAILSANRDHPEAGRYAAEVASARQAQGDSLLEELKAAQAANDPERVLAIHEGLAAVSPGALADVDPPLAKWFMGLIMRRLRGGTVRGDVVDLAGKVAERFAKSVEGASLRASLPTLRRSAGLCPRCARPYRGIADACPACLGAPEAAAPGASPSAWADEPADGDVPAGESSGGDSDYPEFLLDPT